MKYIDRNNVIYKMDCANNPILSVEEHTEITVRTYDCFKGVILPESSTAADLCFDELNPATGPIYITNAAPGDTLKVEILNIKLDEVSVTEIDKEFGCLSSQVEQTQIRRMPVNDNGIRFSEKLYLKKKPMIGVIGVAPMDKPVSTDTPDIHGGNMDCTEIKEGAILYLPVFAEGALLSLGDLHACMGDGEIGGCGAEIGGEVTLRLSVIKKERKLYPVVVTEDKLHVIGCGSSVEAAWTAAVAQMHGYLSEETELTSDEAVMLLSLAGDLSICQTVNPNKTVRMSIPLYCIRAYGWNEK